MEYKHILSLVPQGEDFDASAINEGVWLSTGHLNNIENAGLKADGLSDSLSAANAELTGVKTKNAEQATQIEKDAATIAALQTQVKELGAKPSGQGSTVTAPAVTEVKPEAADGVKFDSAEHPANKFADSQRGYKSDLPAKK